jgi:hypothetical protein
MPALRGRSYQGMGDQFRIAHPLKHLLIALADVSSASSRASAWLLFRRLIRLHRRENAVILCERVCALRINLSPYFRRIPRTLRKKLVKIVCAPNVKHSAAGITILIVRE